MMTGLDCAAPEDVELVAVVSVVVPAVVVGAREEDGGATVEAPDVSSWLDDPVGDDGDEAVVAEEGLAVVVTVVRETGMVGLVPGVVIPLQLWIRPMDASSAFLHTEKLLKQRSFAALIENAVNS